MTDKIEGQYIAILRYLENQPIFHTPPQIVSANCSIDAIELFSLMNVPCVDVVPYVEDDKLFVDDDNNVL